MKKVIIQIMIIICFICSGITTLNASGLNINNRTEKYCGKFTGFVSEKVDMFIKLDNEKGDVISSTFNRFSDDGYRFRVNVRILDKRNDVIYKDIIYKESINESSPVYIKHEKNDKRYMQIVGFFKTKKNSDYNIEIDITSNDDRFWKIVTNNLLIEQYYDTAALPIVGLLRGGKLPKIPRKEIIVTPCVK